VGHQGGIIGEATDDGDMVFVPDFEFQAVNHSRRVDYCQPPQGNEKKEEYKEN
jgi:hypothetical protein